MLEQLDEALDRGERAAQLVRGRGHELALGPLEPGPLAHVAHGPHHPGVGAAEAGGRDGQRSSAVLDQRLLAQCRLLAGKRALLVVHLAAYGESPRSEEHTSELQSRQYLVCRLLLEKKKNSNRTWGF